MRDIGIASIVLTDFQDLGQFLLGGFEEEAEDVRGHGWFVTRSCDHDHLPLCCQQLANMACLCFLSEDERKKTQDGVLQ